MNSIRQVGVQGELWIDGSFLTQKVDPQDVDIVLRTTSTFLAGANPAQRLAIEGVRLNLSNVSLCDSYVLFEFPQGDPNFGQGQWMVAYWIKQFGFSRDENLKGIAVLALP